VLIRPYHHKELLVKYLFYYLSEMSEINSISTKGSAGQVNISLTQSQNMRIPLPPLAEQHRIVAEIERWFTLVDTIEQGKENLGTSIKQAKSKILDLAIHGKLVPQDPNDEPASELLKRINPKAQITCDNEHYAQLPKGWTRIKLGSVARYINGRAFKPEEWMTEGLPIIRIQNLNDDTAYYNRSTSEFEEKYRIKKGDLLFAWAASLGAFLWQGEDAWLNQHIFKVEPYPFIGKMFLYYAFRGLIDEFYRNSHGSGMVHITKRQFADIYLSLPPLEEQKRIVETINILFNVLDTIKENL
ncbi:restriction endonuclease subunit S, partial [Prevotella denticola]